MGRPAHDKPVTPPPPALPFRRRIASLLAVAANNPGLESPPRRAALLRLLHSAAVLVVAPTCARAVAAESCADPASESLRASMNYDAASADPARTCAGCAFYTADASLQACGACTIMSGAVDEGGVCDSWAARSG
jgi:hypothetical protein